jgi:hypothetical protein
LKRSDVATFTRVDKLAGTIGAWHRCREDRSPTSVGILEGELFRGARRRQSPRPAERVGERCQQLQAQRGHRLAVPAHNPHDRTHRRTATAI